MARVTIQDIAKRAGVHYTTVSRALRCDPGTARETCERVRKIAEEMGYRPNVLARGLVGQRTHTVAIVCPRPHDGFYTPLIEVQEQELSQRGYSVLLAVSHFFDVFRTNGDPVQVAREPVEDLVHRGVDGFIFQDAPVVVPEAMAELLRMCEGGVPMVFYVDLPDEPGVRSAAPSGGGYDLAVCDTIQCGYELTRHLLELGHRRIAFIGSHNGGRSLGYQKALREAGIELDERLAVPLAFDFQDVTAVREQLMSFRDRPTALFAYVDDLAIELITELRQAGFRVPEEVSVVGVNDSWHAQHMGLTTMRLPVRRIGAAMVEMLIERIENPEIPPRRRVFESELVVRQSTAPPHVEMAAGSTLPKQEASTSRDSI